MASQHRQTSSPANIALYPKPPPTSGEITRILDLGKLQHLRKSGADDMRELGCAVDDQLAQPRVPLRDEASALDRRHDLAGGSQLARDLHRRRLGDRFDRAVETDLEIDVPLDLIVHQHAAGLLRGEHVDDGRQLLIVHRDLRRDVLRLGPRVGDAHGD